MLWSIRRLGGKRYQVSCVPPDAADENQKNWWTKKTLPLTWMSAPKRVAGKVLAKSIPVHLLIQRDDDGNINVYGSVSLSAKFLKRCLEVLPLGSLNFSDFILVILQGGFSVAIAVTPLPIRQSLYMDSFPEFCSSYVVPCLSSIQECITANKTELSAFVAEVLPALKLCANQAVVVVKFTSTNAQPFVCFCASKCMPIIRKVWSNAEIKELALEAFRAAQTCLRFCVRNIRLCCPTEFLTFIIENRVEISKALLKCTKIFLRALIQAAPFAIAVSQQLCVSTCKTAEEAALVINSLFEQNPELRQQLANALAKLCSLLRENGFSSEDLIPVFCAAVGNAFVLAWNTFHIFWPVISTFVNAHSTILLKVLDATTDIFLPLMCSAIGKIFSSETKDMIVKSLPLVKPFASAGLTLLMSSLKLGVQSTRYLCYKLHEVQPIVFQGSFASFRVINSIGMGFFLTLCEVSPALFAACFDNLPVVKSGVCVVSSDVWTATKFVVPTLYSGVRAVTCDLRDAYLEVYPDLMKAAMVVYPVYVKASCTVTPVLLEVSAEAVKTFYEANCVVIPTMLRSLTVVTPTVWRAAKISAPVIASAGLCVCSTTKRAVSELLRVYGNALSEVISTSINGVGVVKHDLARTCDAVYKDSNRTFERSLRGGVHSVASSAFQEINSLLHIILYIDSLDTETVPETHFQFELNCWKSDDLKSSLCRRSNKILTFSLKAALFCKVCLKKGNSVAASSMCEANIRISQCYEKVEPVVDLAVKSGAYLKSMLQLDRIPENYDDGETVYSLHRSNDGLEKVSLALPSRSFFSLRSFTRDFGHGTFLVLSKTSSSAWSSCLYLGPPLWSGVRLVAPEIWYRLCDISPIVWSSFCKANREAWKGIRAVSPELWEMYILCCALSWKVLCKTTPEVWKVLKDVSPPAWSLMCRASTNIWIRFCESSIISWHTVCKHSPFVWEHLCGSTLITWTAYCSLISASWQLFCSGVGFSWKSHRLVVTALWRSFMLNKSAVNAVLRESSPLLRTLMKLGGDAWFCFCVLTVLSVVLYHRDSVPDLLLGSTLNGMDLSPSSKDLTSEVQGADAVRLPKANLAFRQVLDDIATAKSFLENAKNVVNRYLPVKTAVRIRSKLSVNCKAAKEAFAGSHFQEYFAFFAQSSNVISSLKLASSYVAMM